MNLVDVIAKFARISPNRKAFVEVRPMSGLRKEITWGEFNERTTRLANSLLEEGVQRHEKVFLLGRNSIHWLEAYFSLLKAGSWAVPLNFRFNDEDIRFCASVAEPSAFIFDEEYAGRISALRGQLPTVRHYSVIGSERSGEWVSLEERIRSGSPRPVPLMPADEEECALYFTSGTTGQPKPVLLTHKSLMCIAVTEVINHGFSDSDLLLMMPPLYHLAIGHLLAVMAAGGCSVLLTEKISPHTVVETVAGERISAVFLLVPWAVDLFNALDRKEIKIEEYDLCCWRRTFMGAQPIPPSLVRRLKGYFPDMEYDTIYGLSEGSGPGIIHLGAQNERKVGAIGKPGLLWDTRVVNGKGEDVPQGTVGEIIVKGDGLMKGYYKNPELTATALRNGWLHTGDLGKVDEEGFIYLVDRKKDLIISGGENIYPVEVEAVILSHPKVHDAAVIGTPDDRMGEIATAVIQAKKDEALSQEEISLFIEQHLPRYKRPRRVIFGEVPRSPTGKIEKPKLRAIYS